MMTEDTIRRAAGHPDAIPREYINWFVKGAKWAMENDEMTQLRARNAMLEQMLEKELVSRIDPFELRDLRDLKNRVQILEQYTGKKLNTLITEAY